MPFKLRTENWNGSSPAKAAGDKTICVDVEGRGTVLIHVQDDGMDVSIYPFESKDGEGVGPDVEQTVTPIMTTSIPMGSLNKEWAWGGDQPVGGESAIIVPDDDPDDEGAE